MKKNQKVIIFGTNLIAECALAFFRGDKIANVVAFTVDSKHMKSGKFCGLPVIPYEKLAASFSPKEVKVFVAVGYSDINRNKEKVMNRVRAAGFKLASCISPRATIMPEAKIGENAFIFHGCTIDPHAKIGEGVLIGSNTVVGHHSVVEDYCYLTYQTVIAGSSSIGHHSILGCNATIGASTKIGAYNIVGDGALVCSSTKDNSVYIPHQTPKAPFSAERFKEIMLEPIYLRSQLPRGKAKK